MKSTIKQILEDVYAVDQTLKSQEDQLIILIEQLLHSQPDTKFDEVFVARLKRDLLNRPARKKHWEYFGSPLKMLYLFSGSMAVLLLALMTYSSLVGFKHNRIYKLSFENSITKTNQHAFGDLLAFDNSTNGVESVAESKPVVSRSVVKTSSDEHVGGGSMQGVATMMAVGSSASVPVAVPAKRVADSMIYPPLNRTNYTYTYSGEAVKIENSSMVVYKRNLNGSLANQLGKMIGGVNAGLINLNSFNSLKANSINLEEGIPGGYSLNLDLQNENLSFYRMSNGTAVEDNCGEKTDCVPSYYIAKDQLPSDEEITLIAAGFLQAHGVDLSTWGRPRVNIDWMNNDEYKKSGYVPVNISVVYPQKISDVIVYNENGNPEGVTININLKQKQVESVYNLTSASFVASDYPVITDWNKVLQYALKGGVRPVIYYIMAPSGEQQPVNLDLGTPSLGLVKRVIFGNNQSQELYVPAMVFPVNNQPDNTNNYHLGSVIVPLVEEMWSI